ncbi:MAG: cytochrome c [Gammaproteobacteria bacterium]|nr:cytochrome c [Gammaproteobacteria bacterium]
MMPVLSRTLTRNASVLVAALIPHITLASSHLWDISEIFSNSDGTVQYIELSTGSNTEQELSGQTIVSSGTDVASQQFTFDSDLNGSTANRSVLLATQRFSNLTGLTPDYIISDGFIPLGGGTIIFGGGSDVLNFSREQLPRNSSQSLDGNGQAQDASPTRFDGLTAQIPAQANPFAIFHPSTSVLNVPELNAPGIGIANANFTVNVETLEFGVLDFYLYGAGIVPGNQAAIFNGSSLYIPALLFNDEVYEVNLFPVNDDPITLGNPQVLSVVAVQSDPEPEPEPEPEPDLLQESIDSGQAQYSQLCSSCHGVNGTGGTGPNLRLSAFNTFSILRQYIDSSMPRNNPVACRDTSSSSCATDVANYVLYVFQQN